MRLVDPNATLPTRDAINQARAEVALRKEAYENHEAPNEFVVWPSYLPAITNACTDPCDMLVGHCVCGAYHTGVFRLAFLDGLLTLQARTVADLQPKGNSTSFYTGFRFGGTRA